MMNNNSNSQANRTDKRWVKVISVTLLTCLVFVAVAAIAIRHQYYENLKPVSAAQRSIDVDIPKDSSVKEIAVLLHGQGLIRATWAFEWYVRTKELGDKLQAGTYTFRPNQGVAAIVDELSAGKTAKNLITIVPGYRIDQVRKALIDNGYTPDQAKAALDPAQYAGHPALVDKPAGASLEGYLYPDSYQKDSVTTPEQIINNALDEMQKHLTQDIRAKLAQRGLSVHQGIILASIIEQEVSNPNDRAKVAQVFLSRMQKGMRLESDPTVKYGAILAGQKPSLTYDSAYNTYKIMGLPPGPISNVSASSLQAVAAPAATDYLYFVAGDDGNTYFSKTLEEHQALVAQHCKKLCSQ